MTYSKRRGLKVTKLMARDGCNCKLCGLPLDRHIDDETDPMFVTFDHIVPASEGGTEEIKNLQLAHKCCNEARGCMPIWEFMERWPNGKAPALKAVVQA